MSEKFSRGLVNGIYVENLKDEIIKIIESSLPDGNQKESAIYLVTNKIFRRFYKKYRIEEEKMQMNDDNYKLEMIINMQDFNSRNFKVKGQILTQIDGMFGDEVQRKAVKDQINERFLDVNNRIHDYWMGITPNNIKEAYWMGKSPCKCEPGKVGCDKCGGKNILPKKEKNNK